LSRETKVLEPDSDVARGVAATAVDGDPMAGLPRLSLRQLRLERRLAEWSPAGRLPPPLHWLEEWTGATITVDRPEILWRASGLLRANLIVQFTAHRLGTRLAMGIEMPLAHAMVDRLLGFDRRLGESRLQLTPVEWGIWSFLSARALDSLDANRNDEPGPLRTGDLTIDRVGPDPFDLAGLGAIVTVRWSLRLGSVAGAVRLWIAESVVQLWLATPPEPAVHAIEPSSGSESLERVVVPDLHQAKRGGLSSTWRAVAGFVAMPLGLKRLRVGGVLPLTNSPLCGSPASPSGLVDLVLDLDGQGGRFRIPSRPVADSGGRLVRLEDRPIHQPHVRNPIDVNIREGQSMNQASASRDPSASVAPPAVGPLDVPVTLTVELGRLNLTLTQLADIKPGDVVELNRHSRAPVELTSNGRLVARGELVLIDTDLGVRVTSVFL
jgi:type III secretion system YscQ/HrcQ family protein